MWAGARWRSFTVLPLAENILCCMQECKKWLMKWLFIHRWSFGFFINNKRICLIWKIWYWISTLRLLLCVIIYCLLHSGNVGNFMHMMLTFWSASSDKAAHHHNLGMANEMWQIPDTRVHIVLKWCWLQKSQWWHIRTSGQLIRKRDRSRIFSLRTKMSKFCSSKCLSVMSFQLS